MELPLPRVLLVTALDVVPEGEFWARMERVEALAPEVRARMGVQARDPQLSGRAFFAWSRKLRERTRALGMSFWVNDRLDVAQCLGADGVHLGRRSVGVRDARVLLGPGVKISRSCHAPGEVCEAAREGADMALLSPVFASPGKGAALGVGALREARRLLEAEGLGIFVCALGGVRAENAGACFEAGADGVAAIRGEVFGVAGG